MTQKGRKAEEKQRKNKGEKRIMQESCSPVRSKFLLTDNIKLRPEIDVFCELNFVSFQRKSKLLNGKILRARFTCSNESRVPMKKSKIA